MNQKVTSAQKSRGTLRVFRGRQGTASLNGLVRLLLVDVLFGIHGRAQRIQTRRMKCGGHTHSQRNRLGILGKGRIYLT
jgi:hypothetical protein